jgi:hypothetical protein
MPRRQRCSFFVLPFPLLLLVFDKWLSLIEGRRAEQLRPNSQRPSESAAFHR